jgi:hypothetical protein
MFYQSHFKIELVLKDYYMSKVDLKSPYRFVSINAKIQEVTGSISFIRPRPRVDGIGSVRPDN